MSSLHFKGIAIAAFLMNVHESYGDHIIITLDSCKLVITEPQSLKFSNR